MNTFEIYKHNINVFALRTGIDIRDLNVTKYLTECTCANLDCGKKEAAFATVAAYHVEGIINKSLLEKYLVVVSTLYGVVDKDPFEFIQFGFNDSLKHHLNEAGIKERAIIGETSRAILSAIKVKYGSK